ncbi:MAG: shikimate kinase [Anaerovoracaceae bacterium]|jgi:shikimate kinase
MDCNRIFLIGYMGSGKTTVGKIISRKMGFSFMDIDQEIERAEGISISTIFSEYGEKEFRKKESALLNQLCTPKKPDTKMVISCGGGIILDELNRELLKTQCTIFLNGDPNILFDRVKGDQNRPLAFSQEKDEEQSRNRFLSQYEKRKPLYEETAFYTIHIDGKTPEQIAKEITSHKTPSHKTER